MSRPWFACEEPERPPDGYVKWHYQACTGCLVKGQAQERLFPHDISVRNLVRLLESAGDTPGTIRTYPPSASWPWGVVETVREVPR